MENSIVHYDELGANGFPVCPICGGEMCWSADFTMMESGYVGEDANEEEDGICQNLVCSSCECFCEYEVKDDGYYLLSVRKDEEENEEEGMEYTDYAISLFDGMYKE